MTIKKGDTVAEFETTSFLLPTNSISRPVKTQFGYHIIQALSDVRPGKTLTQKEATAADQGDSFSRRRRTTR